MELKLFNNTDDEGNVEMILKGLTINFLGDSITEGHGTTAPDKVFHQLIKEKYGMKYAYNYGVGGTKIAQQITPTKDRTWHDLNFELRADIMDKNADAVVVFGGTNDYGHGDVFFGDINSENRYTFCGAVNSLISKLMKDFPHAKIIFMTPLHRLNETQPSEPEHKTLEDYVNAIREICKNRNIALIDLFDINPFDPNDADLVPDGLHPNDKGHSVLAEVIARELLKI